MLRISIGIGDTLAVSKREQKGKSLLDCIDDYIVIDLETTGLDPTYDEIIEFAAVRVEGGVVVSKYQSLVRPSFSIESFITELTGITNEMLSTSPSIDVVLPEFLDFVGQSTIVAHNANFDVNFLYDACASQNPFSNDFIDTMRLSRRLFRQERHHRLCDLTERFDIDSDIEHRALSDVLKTQACYEYMKRYIRDNNISLETLYPRSAGVKASGVVSSRTEFDETTPVFGRTFVFTGTLQRLVRKEAMQLVVDMGGICGDGVTTKTNYLVLGSNDYCSSIKDGKSSKHKKAELYKGEGMDIEIISENVFYEMFAEYLSENTTTSGSSETAVPPPGQLENTPDQFEAESLIVMKGLFPDAALRYSNGGEDMEFFLEEIKKIVETSPDYFEGDFEIKHNKGFKTLYFCDIAVIKVMSLKNENRLEVAKKYLRLFGISEHDDNLNWNKITFNDQIANTIYKGSKDVFKKCYKDSAEFTFGCCSRFVECSDAKKCTCKKEYGFNNTKRFPSGCMYKDNLDQGLIFYGKNANLSSKEVSNNQRIF